MNEKKGELIPLIKDKTTRDIIRKEFSVKSGSLLNPANTKQDALQEQLARINRTMAELKEMTQQGSQYLEKEAPELLSPEKGTIDEEAARRSYLRKMQEMKEKREKNNAKVTREYRLTSKRTDPSWDK